MERVVNCFAASRLERSVRETFQVLTHVSPSILEHLQPWASFACELIVRTIRHLNRTEQAFRVRHHDWLLYTSDAAEDMQ